jgi:hypothetical protein
MLFRSVVLCALVAAPALSAPKTDIPTFDPTHFSGAAIDNPFFPLPSGAHWEYRGETPDGIELTTTDVQPGSRIVDGVVATIVHDVVNLNGGLIEDTYDWYAQDSDGNVWYLGEDTKEYDGHGNLIGTAGSWEGGVLGAQPGIQMLAHPEKGDVYAQEYLPGIAEDHARVTDTSAFVTVAAGSYGGALETLEWTPLEPGARETKTYARGIGLVLEIGKKERTELVRATGL